MRIWAKGRQRGSRDDGRWVEASCLNLRADPAGAELDGLVAFLRQGSALGAGAEPAAVITSAVGGPGLGVELRIAEEGGCEQGGKASGGADLARMQRDVLAGESPRTVTAVHDGARGDGAGHVHFSDGRAAYLPDGGCELDQPCPRGEVRTVRATSWRELLDAGPEGCAEAAADVCGGVVLECGRDDLEGLLAFLQYAKAELREGVADHVHLRFHDRAWTEGECDLVVRRADGEGGAR